MGGEGERVIIMSNSTVITVMAHSFPENTVHLHQFASESRAL